MGKNVGVCQAKPVKRGDHHQQKSSLMTKDQKDAQLSRLYVSRGVSFSGANKGLFLGLLTLVMVIVVVIIFLVLKDDVDFASDTLFLLTSGTLVLILSASTLLGFVGLYQIRKLCHNGDDLTTLDDILVTVSSAGVVLYTLFSTTVGVVGVMTSRPGTTDQRLDVILTVVNVLQLVQVAIQNSLIAEGYRRSSWSRHQLFTKPGRQVHIL